MGCTSGEGFSVCVPATFGFGGCWSCMHELEKLAGLDLWCVTRRLRGVLLVENLTNTRVKPFE